MSLRSKYPSLKGLIKRHKDPLIFSAALGAGFTVVINAGLPLTIVAPLAIQAALISMAATLIYAAWLERKAQRVAQVLIVE